MDLDLSTRQLGARAVVTVGGEVDLETASQLGDHALDALREVSPHVALDLTGVGFMDSTGLKVLLTVARRAELAGGSFVVVGPTRPVRKIFSLTGLDQTFTIVETLEEIDGGGLSPGGAPTS